METMMVAPSELHRKVEGAKEGLPPEERWANLCDVLNSENLAVIRRIPELEPFNDVEKETLLVWASRALATPDVSKKDFIFHLLANCKIDADKIISFLETYRTSSRKVLEHLAQSLSQTRSSEKFAEYQRKIAIGLLEEERVASRDRGRHMLMTLAKTEADWLVLAESFSDEDEIYDLRQKVMERFLEECPDQTVLELFAEKVVGMCLRKIESTDGLIVYVAAMHMHWVFSCYERLERETELHQVARDLSAKFGSALPSSVKLRIERYLPKKESDIKTFPRMNVRLPETVGDAIERGWTIRKESGKQVVLVKDGQSITRYRS